MSKYNYILGKDVEKSAVAKAGQDGTPELAVKFTE